MAHPKPPIFNSGLLALLLLMVLNALGWLVLERPSSVPLSEAWWSAWFPIYLVFGLIGVSTLTQRLRGREHGRELAQEMLGECNEDPMFLRRMAIGAAAYIATVVLTHFLLKLSDATAWHAVVAALPLLPFVYIYRGIRLFVADMDEFQYRIFMEACLFTLAMVTGLTLTIGMFQLYEVLPVFSWYWLLAVIFLLFPVGQGMARRKYR